MDFSEFSEYGAKPASFECDGYVDDTRERRRGHEATGNSLSETFHHEKILELSI
jgi:hypothetical protein